MRKHFTREHAEGYLTNFPEYTYGEIIDLILVDWRPHPSSRKRFRRRVESIVLDLLFGVNEEEPRVDGIIEPPKKSREQAVGSTFVFTSAQANTHINENFWNSLLTLVKHKNAELHISRFTYNKQQWGKKSVKPGSVKDADKEDIWFDPRITPYISDNSVQITDDLVWCGELNVIPTRVDPITGFENYGEEASIIIPHTKIAMRSVPTMKNNNTRFCYTTGAVTARNYIERAAGQRASIYHKYGALLVEVDANGTWWARQIEADEEGYVYDLTNKYTPTGKVETDHRVASITHGDLHGSKISRDVLEVMSQVIDDLGPYHQVFHDTVDFGPRNHHNLSDPHFRHKMWVQGTDSIEAEFRYIGDIISKYLARRSTVHHFVTSNHDQAIEKWLRNIDGFYDPVNFHLWLRLNLYCADQRAAFKTPRPFWAVMQKFLSDNFRWNFVHEDDSLVIKGVEHGVHGHLGPNGARGTPKNLRSLGNVNTGHTHSAGIVEGIYTAGVFANLDLGYNKGPSSWSHSFIITYPNGKRTICSIKDEKAWRE